MSTPPSTARNGTTKTLMKMVSATLPGLSQEADVELLLPEHAKDGEMPVLAYGAAKFNPNLNNELSAPTTHLSKTCAKHFPTTIVDDSNSSKVCASCDSRLWAVTKMSDDDCDQEVKGLSRYSSTACPNVSFKNRDFSAAICILRCFQAGANRLTSLSCNPTGPTKKVPMRYLCLRAAQGSMTAI